VPIVGVNSHAYPIDSRALALMVSAGFTGVRVEFMPWWISNGDFGPYDDLYAACVKSGIRPLFLLANPQTPYQLKQHIETAPIAAARYPQADIEIFNESNQRQYWPAPQTPASWWAQAKPVAYAWKRANPMARLCTGGTSGTALQWQRELAQLGVFRSGLFAAAGVHPYGVKAPGERGSSLAADYAALAQLIGPDLQIWATEFGAPNATGALVTAWISAHRAMGVRLYWYEIQDDSVDGRIQPYGLIREDYTTKPSYDAAKATLRTAVSTLSIDAGNR
jgi:hypothetical protein